VLLTGEHDGYRRQPGGPIHHRVIVWLPPDGLLVIDRVASSRSHEVSSRLHLDPAAAVVGGRVGTIAITALGALAPHLVSERHAPWLGCQVDADGLVQEGVVAPGEPFGWSLLREGAAVLDLDAERVRIRRGRGTVLELALQWPPPPAGRSLPGEAPPAPAGGRG
jgi:hypothetical protein